MFSSNIKSSRVIKLIQCECCQRNWRGLAVVGRSSTGSATSWLWSTWTAWRSDNTRAPDPIDTGFNLFTSPPLFPFAWADPAHLNEPSVLQWECTSTSRVGMQDLAHFFNLPPLLSSVHFLFWRFLLHDLLCQIFLPNPWGSRWDFSSFEITTCVSDHVTGSLPYAPSRRKSRWILTKPCDDMGDIVLVHYVYC